MGSSRRAGPERGQASIEHLGLTALVAMGLAAGLALAAPPAMAVPQALAGALCSAVQASCGPEQPPPSRKEVVDRYMAADLHRFLLHRAGEDRDPRLDWSTDLCSAPVVGSTGNTFDFTEPCIRHDFGYRNYHRLGLFPERRRAVDERFLADMRDHCATRVPWQRLHCRLWARAFYQGVRELGWAAAG